MKLKNIFVAGSALALSLGFLADVNYHVSADEKDTSAKSGEVDATDSVKKQKGDILTSYSLMTKVAGNKNYKVWKVINKGKPQGKVADGIDFRYSHIQSTQSIKTSKYTYWFIYVNGRPVGWVNQNYFARNAIAVPKTVSLVRNENALFDSRDAISYATDATGTVVDNSEVSVSRDSVSCTDPKTYKIKYSIGDTTETVKVTVRKSTREGIGDANAVQGQNGVSDLKSWKSHYGSSLNYISPREFQPETKLHTFTTDDLSLTTRLYQPVLLSVKTDTDDGNINRVGHIPEGVTVSNGWAYTSLLSHTNLLQGHIVGYNLEELTDPFETQNLLTMPLKDFINYAKNIKVSPYIPIGHGQAMGATDKYIYVLVNDHSEKLSNDSEELIQIRKSDMLINKIWTIKCWNGSQDAPRYFQNAVITSDYQMYGLYYDPQSNRYEYWELNRTGDNWYPQIVGATKGTLVGDGSPVQGFTYDPKNQNFYIAFNDLLVKLSRSGEFQKSYAVTTGREIEGISVSNDRLYINLAQRAELLESNKLR